VAGAAVVGAGQPDWVVAVADQVIARAKDRALAGPLTCASGLSPSGPIHLGNLREIMVPHFVAGEIRSRGLPCRHILSWDDYDRFRKVPAGISESFAEHIGRPLTAVPDPCGQHESWAEHFKAPFRVALDQLGVEVTEISQTQMYTTGAYRAEVLSAMRDRDRISVILNAYRTGQAADDAGAGVGAGAGVAGVARAGGTGGAAESDEDADPATDPAADPAADLAAVTGAYYPFKPYCQVCRRDSTTVVSFDDASSALSYRCACGHEGGFALDQASHGKLVWKVDWPMRWAFEAVIFEAAGVDHSSPGSSFTVGSRLVRAVFGGLPPVYLGYSFVGTSGAAKMSSSVGGAPTPADALSILEPPLLRWMYARRKPSQSITVSFDSEVGRVYDEWDALGRRVVGGQADSWERANRYRAAVSSRGPLPATPRLFPFRTLASLVDITAGQDAQILRILADLDQDQPVTSLDEVRPRLDLARTWVRDYVPAADRTAVRAEPDSQRLAQLTTDERQAIAMLLDGLEANWSLVGLTALVYGVPKLQAGLPADASPTPALKAAQRALFTLLYELLIGRDTGPRLPTLMLALGPRRIRSLLAPEQAPCTHRGPP
jgi:lysyl-tRNA synthetase, class I